MNASKLTTWVNAYVLGTNIRLAAKGIIEALYEAL